MNQTIYERFRSVVAEHGEEPAVIETVRTLTFSELSDMVDMIAKKMPADTKTVGVVLNHTAEMIATILAVLKCGAMYVPAEPEFPRGRIEMMMEEATVDYVLTEAEYANKLRKFPVVTMDRLFPKLPNADPESAYVQDPERPAYVLYTSGTTGRPKGVCVSNRNVVHYVDAFANEFHPGPGDIMLQYSVCSFDIFVEEVFCSLLNGYSLAGIQKPFRLNHLQQYIGDGLFFYKVILVFLTHPHDLSVVFLSTTFVRLTWNTISQTHIKIKQNFSHYPLIFLYILP